jgi:hypothetical protein
MCLRLLLTVALIAANAGLASAAEKKDAKGTGTASKCVAGVTRYHDYASCLALQTKGGYLPQRMEAFCHQQCPGG